MALSLLGITSIVLAASVLASPALTADEIWELVYDGVKNF
jgi:hypothetical protein